MANLITQTVLNAAGKLESQAAAIPEAVSEKTKAMATAIEDLGIACDAYCRDFEEYAVSDCKDAKFMKDGMKEVIAKVFNDDLQ